MGKLVVVSGNLGAGKSTLINVLAQRLGGSNFSEDPSEYPYLQDMYGDVARWCFPNQLSFMIRKAEEQLQITESNSIGFQERGVYETHEVFSRVFFQQGALEERDFQMLTRALALLEARLRPPDLIVYLYADISLLLSRIDIRGRSTESTMWPVFLGKIDHQYKHWMGELEKEAWTATLRLNMANLDFARSVADVEEVCMLVEAALPRYA